MIDVSLKSRPSPLLRSRQNRSIASRDHSTRSESFVTVPKPRFIFHPQKKRKKEKDFFSSFSLALFRSVISFEIISTAVARTKTKGMSYGTTRNRAVQFREIACRGDPLGEPSSWKRASWRVLVFFSNSSPFAKRKCGLPSSKKGTRSQFCDSLQ